MKPLKPEDISSYDAEGNRFRRSRIIDLEYKEQLAEREEDDEESSHSIQRTR